MHSTVANTENFSPIGADRCENICHEQITHVQNQEQVWRLLCGWHSGVLRGVGRLGRHRGIGPTQQLSLSDGLNLTGLASVGSFAPSNHHVDHGADHVVAAFDCLG
jgi:hypothetical protein